MRWWLIPAVATLPLLGIACSDSASNVTPEQTPKTSRPESRQANAGTFVLTYFTVPG